MKQLSKFKSSEVLGGSTQSRVKSPKPVFTNLLVIIHLFQVSI